MEAEANQSHVQSHVASSLLTLARQKRETGMGGRRMRGRGRHMWPEGALFWAFDQRPSSIDHLR